VVAIAHKRDRIHTYFCHCLVARALDAQRLMFRRGERPRPGRSVVGLSEPTVPARTKLLPLTNTSWTVEIMPAPRVVLAFQGVGLVITITKSDSAQKLELGSRVSLEDRLFVVVREAVNGPFENFGELATRIRDSEPEEFTYNRLDEGYVMMPESIVTYVSLVTLLGLIQKNSGEMYECVLDGKLIKEGTIEVINQKAVDLLSQSGFSREKYVGIVRRLLKGKNIIMPQVRSVYQEMSIKITEQQFLHLSNLTAVRAHFGFTVVTRRIMLPTQVEE
jgi:hypothetical protein